MIFVLYVDDEYGLLEVAKLFLERDGQFTIDIITSAQAALPLLDSKKYDIVISDYQMPGMDGIEFLKEVRTSGNSIPFILFTGRGREEVVIDAINNGADFYIQKGGDPKAQFAELAHKIRQGVLMRQTQMTLAEQEERYHDLQNANDLIQSVAPDGHFQFVNKKWLDTLGYKEEDLPGLTIFNIIHEENLKHCIETFQRVISGENVGIIDATFKTRDGVKVYVQGMVNCKLAEGTCQYARGIFKDVTDRKMAELELFQKNEELTATEEELRHNFDLLSQKEQALRESEEKFRSIFENSPYPIAINSLPNNKFLEVNKAFLDIGEYTEEELLGKDPVEMGFLHLTDALRLISSRVLKGKIENVPIAVTAKGGKRVHALFSTMPITINNKPATVTLTAEVTKLKRVEEELLCKNEDLNAAYEKLTATDEEIRANYDVLHKNEEAIRASEEKLRVLVELSLDGIIITDFLGKLLFANRAAGLIMDAPDYEAMIGKNNVMDFIAPESKVDVLRDFAKVMGGIDTYLVNYKLISVMKREVLVECIGKKIKFGDSSAILISMRDVTESKLAEQAIRQANKKLHLLSSITRHDINNQLQVLDGFVTLLQDQIPDLSFEHNFSRINTAINQITNMIQFTKEYEKIGVNAPIYQDIRILVEKAGKDNTPGQITLKNDLPANTEIFADPLITKVFFNLIDNAVCHGGKITTIRFSLEERDQDQVIVCADDGDGVPAEEKERIFELGFGKNTGLGLAISREILDITGITFKETGEPGKGARFEIVIPKNQFRFVS